MAKVFFDIGGFHGTSALAGLDPIFRFDRIFTVEPSPKLAELIKTSLRDARCIVLKCGLSSRTAQTTLYNSGNLGASVYDDAPVFGSDGVANNESIQLVDASLLFDLTTTRGDEIYIKLNCEGSEIDILESLLESESLRDIRNILIDLDALKSKTQSHRVPIIMQRVKESGVPFFFPEEVQYFMVTNYGGVRNWLIRAGAAKGAKPIDAVRSFIFNLKVFLQRPDCNGYHKKLILDRITFLRFFARSKRRSP